MAKQGVIAAQALAKQWLEYECREVRETLKGPEIEIKLNMSPSTWRLLLLPSKNEPGYA